MPLLGKKIFAPLVASSASKDEEEEDSSKPFIIKQTQERFATEKEYNARVELYEKPLWTCQCTGHANLTFHDAYKSEKAAREKLVKLYPVVYEEVVLQLVHHQYASLETIIASAQTLFQTTFSKDEKVTFTVKIGKTFEATIVCRHDAPPDVTTTTQTEAIENDDSNDAIETSTNSDEVVAKEDTSSTTNSVSPSSDKENKSKVGLTEGGASASAKSGDANGKASAQCPAKKKLTMLPAKYDLHLTVQNKIVSCVPVEHLTRVSKPPNRELIRLFIRANAIRPHNTKEKFPWIVEEDMVSRYTITAQIPAAREREMMRMGTVDGDNKTPPPSGENHKSSKKSAGDEKSSVKRDHGGDSGGKVVNGNSSSDSGGGGKSSAATHNGTKNSDHSPHEDAVETSDFESSPTKKKSTTASGKKTGKVVTSSTPTTSPTKKMAPIFSKVIKSPSSATKLTSPKSPKGRARGRPRRVRDEKAEPAPKITAAKKRKSVATTDDKSNTATTTKRKKKTSDISKNKDVQMVLQSLKQEPQDGGATATTTAPTPSPRGRPKGSLNGSGVGRKKKQATLMEMARKNAGKMMTSRGLTTAGGASTSGLTMTQSSFKNAFKKMKQPNVVQHLMSLKREKKFRPHKYKLTLNSAVRLLTDKQRDNLPAEVKDDVVKKWEHEELKKKFLNMTPEERRAYKKERRRQQRENNEGGEIVTVNAGGNIIKKRGPIEDQFLVRDSKSRELPLFTPVELPDELGNAMFGKLAMLCEFIYSYHHLLHPKDSSYHKQFNIFSLTEAVTSGSTGFALTSKLLVTLLQTLLADDVAKDYTELDYNLSQVAVQPEISCELTRICLRLHDDDGEEKQQQQNEENSDNNDEKTTNDCDPSISSDVAEGLLNNELYMMTPGDQIDVISALAYRVMNTYSVQIHMEDARQRVLQAWSEVNGRRKAVKQEQKEKGILEGPKKRGRKPVPKPSKPEAKKAKIVDQMAAEIDLVSRVKKRQQMTELRRQQEAEERKKQMEEERIEMEEERKRMDHEKCDRMLHDARIELRNSQRRIPLGTDRNHSRYWLLCDGIPGLYVERGWVGNYISYSTISTQQINAQSKNDDSTSRAALLKEATWPITGPNIWYMVPDQEQYENLLEALNSDGTRESKLLNSFKTNLEAITRSIKRRQTMAEALKESTEKKLAAVAANKQPLDGDEFQRRELRKTLLNLLKDGCRGALVEIEDDIVYESVENRINSAENAQDFASLILTLLDHIPPKFLKQYMTGVPERRKKAAEPENTDADHIPEREKLKAEKRVQRFRENVENATLFSRCAFLLAILNNSIRWDLYHYRRSSRRARTRKNYADKDKNDEEEEGESSEEEEEEGDDEDMEVDEEEDDDGQRRSSRLRSKRSSTSSRRSKTLASPEARPVRSARQKTRNYRAMVEDEEEEDSSPAEEEEVMDEVERGSDDSQVGGSDDDSQVEGSDDDEDDDDDEEEEADACVKIINKLLSFAYTELFRAPVNATDYADYYRIIKEPLSLTEILDKAQQEEEDGERLYTFQQLVKDVRLIVDNAIEYNGLGHFVAKDAQRLARAFKRQSCTMLQLNEESSQFLNDLFPE